MALSPYVYPTTPTAFSTVATEALFTSLQLFAEFPDMRRQFMRRHNMYNSFYARLKEMGLGRPLKSPNTQHYEQDWIKNNFKVGSATVPGGAGATMVITLHAESMFTTSIMGQTVAFSYPIVGDIIEIKVSRVQAQIIAKDETVNPNTITVKPIQAADSLVGAVTAGDRIFIVSNAFAEGTGQPKGRVERWFKYMNVPQIIKHSFVITGSAMTDEIPVIQPIPGQTGSYLIIGTENEEMRHYDAISGALLFGQLSDNITDVPHGVSYNAPVRTTEGMIEYASTRGNTYQHTKTGVVLADFDAYSAIMERERIQGDILLHMQGYRYGSALENALIDFVDTSCFEYVSRSFGPVGEALAGADPQDFFVHIGFKGIKKGGYYHLFTKMNEFNDIMGAGTTGYSYPDISVIAPLGVMRNKNWNEYIPTIGYDYKALGGYSREYETWKLGGAGLIQHTSDIDEMSVEIRSEISAHYALANQWIFSVPAP
jgi:hypothetical protein